MDDERDPKQSAEEAEKPTDGAQEAEVKKAETERGSASEISDEELDKISGGMF